MERERQLMSYSALFISIQTCAHTTLTCMSHTRETDAPTTDTHMHKCARAHARMHTQTHNTLFKQNALLSDSVHNSQSVLLPHLSWPVAVAKMELPS